VSRIVFITGTGTGVGKTLLTAMLVHHQRQAGLHALAIKPFCSGGLGDVELLEAIQEGELSAKEINAFHFPEPVTPLVGARGQGRRIELEACLGLIRTFSRRAESLLVEGAGGLLAPLGEQFTLADMAKRLRAEMIVVGPNQLGVLNHTLLTVEALRSRGLRRIRVVLMEQARPDVSARKNVEILGEWLDSVEISTVPFLGQGAMQLAAIKKNAKKIKKTLAHISSSVSVSLRSLERLAERRPRPNG